jgi:signal transduction protein with GAF and PtsI domain
VVRGLAAGDGGRSVGHPPFGQHRGPAQSGQIDWAGVDGVGLYRSEALFMRYREGFPAEDEECRVYRRLFAAAGERPVVFRTADLGADKPVEHMRLGPQTNPSLGLRAHRLFRFHPEILVVQIRAVLRAACGRHRLRLLSPRRCSVPEVSLG